MSREEKQNDGLRKSKRSEAKDGGHAQAAEAAEAAEAEEAGGAGGAGDSKEGDGFGTERMSQALLEPDWSGRGSQSQNRSLDEISVARREISVQRGLAYESLILHDPEARMQGAEEHRHIDADTFPEVVAGSPPAPLEVGAEEAAAGRAHHKARLAPQGVVGFHFSVAGMQREQGQKLELATRLA